MTRTVEIVILLSAMLFFIYGSLVLFAGGMREEFQRFGLARFRRATGALEILGGAGLLVGLRVTEVLVAASGGLAVLMLLGVITRVRVRDGIVETLPALVLMLVNTAIVTVALAAL